MCFQVLQNTADFIAEVGSKLSRLPGFDVQDTCLWDWMHCSPLGIEGYSNGATLLELMLEGRWGLFGGAWKIRAGIALKRLLLLSKRSAQELGSNTPNNSSLRRASAWRVARHASLSLRAKPTT